MGEVIDLTDSPPAKRARVGVEGGAEDHQKERDNASEGRSRVFIDLDGEADETQPCASSSVALQRVKASQRRVASPSSHLTDEELAARLAAAEQSALLWSDRDLACRLAASEQQGDPDRTAAGKRKDSKAGTDILQPQHFVGFENEPTGKTQGVLEALHQCLMEEAEGTVEYEAYICTDTVFYSSVHADKGWSCGYRNAQMIFSHLLSREDSLQACFPYQDRFNFGAGVVPSVYGLQSLIEDAWSRGFDEVGAKQLGHKVIGTRKWIGTTEVASMLRGQGVRAQIVDFSSLVAPHGRDLVRWVYSYFTASRLQQCKTRSTMVGRVQFSKSAPLYLQHQGHSRLIVGVCRKRGVDELIILDPGANGYELKASLRSRRDWQRKVSFALGSFKARQHQVFYFWLVHVLMV